MKGIDQNQLATGQSVSAAISTCLGQLWRELGRIPGPIFREKS